MISEDTPTEGVWPVVLYADRKPAPIPLGELLITEGGIVTGAVDAEVVSTRLAALEDVADNLCIWDDAVIGPDYALRFGDGISGASRMDEGAIDLLLTDPPYGISNAYTCEKQIPRRLRKDGTDFIMPRGHFGDWDSVEPKEWTDAVLPKVGGWAVIFCAQAQIGEYSEILRSHRFNSVGTLVWQKTNPVPFNHKYKPINAWEALVVGKRPGTPFNGNVVHNVFQYKSPSPQQRIHPTQKPIPLLERFIELFSKSGDSVFDPFAGSASTVIAAVRLGRNALAFEADYAIFHKAIERIRREIG